MKHIHLHYAIIRVNISGISVITKYTTNVTVIYKLCQILFLSFNCKHKQLTVELWHILWMEHFVGILCFLSNKRLLSPNYTLEWKMQAYEAPFFFSLADPHSPHTPPTHRMAIYLAKQKLFIRSFSYYCIVRSRCGTMALIPHKIDSAWHRVHIFKLFETKPAEMTKKL